MTTPRQRPGRSTGGWSFEDGDVLCWDLPTSTEPDAARMLLRWTLTDLFAYLTGPRRPRGDDGRPRPLTVILEELSALDDDPVIMRQVVNAMERARAAGARFVIVAQGPSGLGDDRTQDAVLTNATVVTFRQISEAQRVSDLAGTETRLEASGSYEGHGVHGWQRGSAREQETYKVSPNEVRGLDVGDAFAIHRGRAALVTVALPAGAFGQPPPPGWLDELRPVPALSLSPPADEVTRDGSGQDRNHSSDLPPDGWGRSSPAAGKQTSQVRDKPGTRPADHQHPHEPTKGSKQP